LYQTGKVINPLSISRYTRNQYITSIGLIYKEVGGHGREIHREERERLSTNFPANPILTNFTYSESLSILPLIIHKWNITQIFLCNTIIYMFWN